MRNISYSGQFLRYHGLLLQDPSIRWKILISIYFPEHPWKGSHCCFLCLPMPVRFRCCLHAYQSHSTGSMRNFPVRLHRSSYAVQDQVLRSSLLHWFLQYKRRQLLTSTGSFLHSVQFLLILLCWIRCMYAYRFGRSHSLLHRKDYYKKKSVYQCLSHRYR